MKKLYQTQIRKWNFRYTNDGLLNSIHAYYDRVNIYDGIGITLRVQVLYVPMSVRGYSGAMFIFMIRYGMVFVCYGILFLCNAMRYSKMIWYGMLSYGMVCYAMRFE